MTKVNFAQFCEIAEVGRKGTRVLCVPFRSVTFICCSSSVKFSKHCHTIRNEKFRGTGHPFFYACRLRHRAPEELGRYEENGGPSDIIRNTVGGCDGYYSWPARDAGSTHYNYHWENYGPFRYARLSMLVKEVKKKTERSKKSVLVVILWEKVVLQWSTHIIFFKVFTFSRILRIFGIKHQKREANFLANWLPSRPFSRNCRPFCT